MERRHVLKLGGALTSTLLYTAASGHAAGAAPAAPASTSLQLMPVPPTGVIVLAPAPNVVPLTVEGAVGQTASLQEWKDGGGAKQFTVMADGRPGLVPQTWRGDGRTKPSLAFSSDPDTGFTQMPGVVDDGSIAIISNGFFAATMDISPSAFVFSTRTTNRLMFHSQSALVLAASAGHFEIESGHGPRYESSITGYQIGTANSTSVVFTTDPTVRAACPLAVRLPKDPTVDAFQVRDSNNVPLARIDRAGRMTSRATTEPTLNDLSDGEVMWWVDSASGDPKVTRRFGGTLATQTLQVRGR